MSDSGDWDLAEYTPVKKRPRLVVFGEPKIGKTVFGCSAPNGVLVPTEDGAASLPVMRLPKGRTASSWEDILKSIRVLLETEHDREWFILDTINGAADLCSQFVCDRDFGGAWESGKGREGYNAWGRGDKACGQEFRRLIKGLDLLRDEKGMGCILLGHQGLSKSGNALGEDFQKFTADMSKQTWSLTLGWADHIAHACRDFVVTAPRGKEDTGKGKVRERSQERWLVFEGGPGRDAGSRAGLEMPDRIPLSWDAYAEALAKCK